MSEDIFDDVVNHYANDRPQYAGQMTEDYLWSIVNANENKYEIGRDGYVQKIDKIAANLKKRSKDEDSTNAINHFLQRVQENNYDPNMVHWYGMMLAADLNAPGAMGAFLEYHRKNNTSFFDIHGKHKFQGMLSPAKEEIIFDLMECDDCRYYIGNNENEIRAMLIKLTPKLTQFEQKWAAERASSEVLTEILKKSPSKEQLKPIVRNNGENLSMFSHFFIRATSDKELATADSIIDLVKEMATIPTGKREDGMLIYDIFGNQAIPELAELAIDTHNPQMTAKIYNTMVDIVEKQPDYAITALKVLNSMSRKAKEHKGPIAYGDKDILQTLQRLQNTALKAFERSFGAEISKAMAYNNGNMGNNPHTK